MTSLQLVLKPARAPTSTSRAAQYSCYGTHQPRSKLPRGEATAAHAIVARRRRTPQPYIRRTVHAVCSAHRTRPAKLAQGLFMFSLHHHSPLSDRLHLQPSRHRKVGSFSAAFARPAHQNRINHDATYTPLALVGRGQLKPPWVRGEDPAHDARRSAVLVLVLGRSQLARRLPRAKNSMRVSRAR